MSERPPAFKPRPALRRRLVESTDTVFFSCSSVLLGLLASVAGLFGVMGLAGVVQNFVVSLWVPGEVVLGVCLLIFGLITALAFVSSVLPYIDVGTDGVAFRERLTRRFIGYADLARAFLEPQSTGYHSHLVLALRNGTEVRIRIDTIDAETRDEVFDRLQQEIHRFSLVTRQQQALEALDRKGRSLQAWQLNVSRLLGQGVDYRSAQVARADVESTLESGAASAERRVGAALALASTRDVDAPMRIRIAARASANAKLRIALESIADGDWDAEVIEEALEASQDEHDRVEVVPSGKASS